LTVASALLFYDYLLTLQGEASYPLVITLGYVLTLMLDPIYVGRKEIVE